MKKFITSFLLFSCLISYGQKEANIWYFGYNAGLDFNSGSPVVLTNSAMSQFEGVSSISNQNGSLLFYTDGISVWNANHLLMSNGTGLFGNTSSSQSALIVKQPGSANLYYIFTVDAQLAPNGFNYSIVDMSLNSGLGDVTSKNVFMYTPSSEKLTAITQANGFDIWIITHDYNNNNFQSYSLTSAGFNTTPVTTSIGPALLLNADVVGYIKVSPDGSRLAMAVSASDQFWVFDFNIATGVVSNAIQLFSAGGGSNGAYGVEFSPNSHILYGTVEGPPIHLFQWDLSSGNAATINTSRIDLNPTLIGANYIGSLSLAPDKKIYFTRNTCDYLGAVNNPDIVGPGCNMIDSAIYLQGKQCVYGLPNLCQSLYNNTFAFTQPCFGDSTHFSVRDSIGLLGAHWNFGDPNSGLDNFSNLLNPAHLFTFAGTFPIRLIRNYGSHIDTSFSTIIIQANPVVTLGADTSFCSGGSFTLHAGSGFTSYLWHDGSTDSTFTATASGICWVTVFNSACSATDSVVLTANPCTLPIINIVASDSTFCDKKCIDFTDNSTNNPTSWHWSFPGAIPNSSTLQNPVHICYNNAGSFDVTLIACNASGCDTVLFPDFIVELPVPPTPTVTRSNDTLFSSPGFSYQWFYNSLPIPGATASYYVAQNWGYYFVSVADSNGCASSSTDLIASVDNFIDNNSGFIVSPNPSDGHFEISFANKIIPGDLVLTDALGKIIFQMKIINQVSEFSLGYLANGVYFLRFTIGKSIINKKIFVNR